MWVWMSSDWIGFEEPFCCYLCFLVTVRVVLDHVAPNGIGLTAVASEKVQQAVKTNCFFRMPIVAGTPLVFGDLKNLSRKRLSESVFVSLTGDRFPHMKAGRHFNRR